MNYFAKSNEISEDASSKECFDLVKGWINNCFSNHPGCGGKDKTLPFILPRRVIWVGSEDREEPRLALTDGGGLERYAALSHCWGDPEKILDTKTLTLQERLHCISLSALPKTFQDAVIITRNLGLKFLWIDSLCILQDSKEDWEIESAKMASIYANAFVTISASGSPDSQGGCFLDSGNRSIHIPSTNREGKLACVGVRERRHLNTFETGQLPLNGRGWVLQESLLSVRKLLYTGKELVWECHTSIACECSPKFRPNPGDQAYPASMAGTRGRRRVATHWSAIVEQFTKRNLTKQQDRLVAIAGLASAMNQIWPDEYLCGLWKSNLNRGLLWFNVDENSQRHNSYYAPSWTWASITGKIRWEPSSSVYYAKEAQLKHTFLIERVVCEPATANQYGPAKRGHLKVIGLVIPVNIMEGGLLDGIRFLVASSVRSDNGVVPSCLVRPDIGDYREELLSKSPFLFLILSKSTRRTRTYDEDFCISGLILRKLPSGGNKYQRVGFASSAFGMVDRLENRPQFGIEFQGTFLYNRYDHWIGIARNRTIIIE